MDAADTPATRGNRAHKARAEPASYGCEITVNQFAALLTSFTRFEDLIRDEANDEATAGGTLPRHR